MNKAKTDRTERSNKLIYNTARNLKVTWRKLKKHWCSIDLIDHFIKYHTQQQITHSFQVHTKKKFIKEEHVLGHKKVFINLKWSKNIHWKDWCWSWSSNTLATWCEELTHLKRRQCWERLKVGGEGDNRGWSGWMASPTQWTWVWVSSGSWWWTGGPGMLQSMGLQRVRHDWVTELNLY